MTAPTGLRARTTRSWPADVYELALDGDRPLAVRGSDGTRRVQPVRRWTQDADAVDTELLGRCTGPAVDLGCGPGRLTAALARRGVPALGVDLSARAVALTRARGGVAIRRDLFAPLPGEGRWSAALLADGNIGIGGDPARLLARVARLLRPGGDLLVEVDADDVDRRLTAQLVTGHRSSSPFPWAELGGPALRRLARHGWTVHAEWSGGGRWFSHLLRR